jgi:hypothetical protein
MDKFLRNKSFEIQFTLTYKDTGLAIDLDGLTEITVEIKNHKTQNALVTKTLTDGGVAKITAASGICSVYINGADTVNADKGQYDYVVTVELANANFDDSTADFAGYSNAFVLE